MSSILGFSKPSHSDFYSSNYTKESISTNPLHDYVSLRPGFEESRIAPQVGCIPFTLNLDA